MNSIAARSGTPSSSRTVAAVTVIAVAPAVAGAATAHHCLADNGIIHGN